MDTNSSESLESTCLAGNRVKQTQVSRSEGVLLKNRVGPTCSCHGPVSLTMVESLGTTGGILRGICSVEELYIDFAFLRVLFCQTAMH